MKCELEILGARRATFAETNGLFTIVRYGLVDLDGAVMLLESNVEQLGDESYRRLHERDAAAVMEEMVLTEVRIAVDGVVAMRGGGRMLAVHVRVTEER